MKNELGGQAMKEFVGLRANSYLKDNNDEDKNVKGRKECDIKKRKFQNYKNCLEVAQIENKRKHLEKDKIELDSSLKNNLTQNH